MILELTPRPMNLSLTYVLENMASIAAMLGNPNMAPAWNRVKPSPTSKYDGNHVRTTVSSAYMGITAASAPMNVRVRKIDIHGTAGAAVVAKPLTPGIRTSPYGPGRQV